MKLFRKSAQPSSRRQRLPSNDLESRSTFLYHTRHSDQELTVGRQVQRSGPTLTARLFGRYWLQRIGVAVLLVAIIVSLVNILSVSSEAKVSLLTSGSSNRLLRDQKMYQDAASKLLSSSIWNRNKITINTGKLSNDMLHEFPEFSSVSVTLPLLAHRPIFYVQPAQPALILIASNGSFLLDTTGKALLASSNTPLSNTDNLPQVNDQSGLQVKLNQRVLTADNVSFIQTVVGQLAARHVGVTSLSLPAAASELDVHLAGQPYFVKFNLQSNDARQQAGTFLAAQNQLQQQHITPSSYIDVRVDGRAYYK